MICIVRISQYVQYSALRALYEPSQDISILQLGNITLWLLYSTQYSTIHCNDIVYNTAYNTAL